MKDFIKWLGVNEKIAKVVVWLLIIMVFLIIINAAMESAGFPNYAITYQNIIRIDTTKLINTIISGIIAALNFYAIVLLVFRVKEIKTMFKYLILYLVLNYIVKLVFGFGGLQVFIVLFIIIFCYLYSKRQKKYILYGILALLFDSIIQWVWFSIKAKLVDYSAISSLTKTILSFDYFIIMIIIILVKEIYLRKRSEKVCGMDSDAGFGLENSKTKVNSQRKSQRKSQTQLNKK